MDLWILTGVYGLFAMAAAYLSQRGGLSHER
jgi:hypothetical protein